LLTADLVHVRRRGDRLALVPIAEADRPRALELARSVIGLIRAHVGLPRGALLEAWAQVPIAPSESRLARALFKLATDACVFDESGADEAGALRMQVFSEAARARRTSSKALDRDAILDAIARTRGSSADHIEASLYADLPTAHLLREAPGSTAERLLAEHETASHQAILLRAVKVRARVHCAAASGYRALFRRLKFHQLLYGIRRLDRGRGYEVELDGPFSLFEQTTRYGLKLALALPSIMACDAWEVTADLRWGKERRPLVYHLRGNGVGARDDAPPLADEVRALLAELTRIESAWTGTAADVVLDLPGIGVCVPDLAFVHRDTGRKVYFEVLGFWSRSAVWKRIDMVQSGLPQPILFAISKHLRVSEEALPDDLPSALYVYARVMNARAVLARLDDLAGRHTG
jgi:predicted nuclease of restriction endonuclease-like RecB superfamily